MVIFPVFRFFLIILSVKKRENIFFLLVFALIARFSKILLIFNDFKYFIDESFMYASKHTLDLNEHKFKEV